MRPKLFSIEILLINVIIYISNIQYLDYTNPFSDPDLPEESGINNFWYIIIGIVAASILIIIIVWIVDNHSKNKKLAEKKNEEKETKEFIQHQRELEKIRAMKGTEEQPITKRSITCRYCGYANPEDLIKCQHCGAAL